MLVDILLPQQHNFILIREDDRGCLLTDRKSDRFQVLIPDLALWGQIWKVHLGEQKGKSNATVYLQRLRIRCVSQVGSPSHVLHREEIKGVLYSAYQSQFVYAAHLGGLFWLSYSLSPIPCHLPLTLFPNPYSLSPKP